MFLPSYATLTRSVYVVVDLTTLIRGAGRVNKALSEYANVYFGGRLNSLMECHIT